MLHATVSKMANRCQDELIKVSLRKSVYVKHTYFLTLTLLALSLGFNPCLNLPTVDIVTIKKYTQFQYDKL